MKLLLLVLSTLTTACCAHSRPGPALLSKTQFALTSLFGKRIICASAARSICGLSLSDCSEGLIIECAIDVIIIDVKVKQEVPPEAQKDEI